MKQLLILSGKGGTGKTTLASSLIKLYEAKAYADCDVDAPNLHLLLGKEITPEHSDFMGMKKAEIDEELCRSCGICKRQCKFEAISYKNMKFSIDNRRCEGCGLCVELCPAKAISLKEDVAGDLRLYADKNIVFSSAKLKMGSGTSGKLVSSVKKQLLDKVDIDKEELAIIDGSPGIGCPVISSLSGVDKVIIVTEPTISAISDMKRIVNTARKFQVNAVVCINKYDVNIEKCNEILEFCQMNDIECIGKIPFDVKAVEAINEGITVVEVDCAAGAAIKEVFKKINI